MTSIQYRSTISKTESKMLASGRKEIKYFKQSSMLGVCSVTDDWRERHNRKPKVVFQIKSIHNVGVR